MKSVVCGRDCLGLACKKQLQEVVTSRTWVTRRRYQLTELHGQEEQQQQDEPV